MTKMKPLKNLVWGASKMDYDNEIELVLSSNPKNEAVARVSVSSFIMELNPSMSELTDVRTAVSEAVTNSIIHGYENKKGRIYIKCAIKDRTVYISVEDRGVGIKDVGKAMLPLYTSKPELERSGMGFTVMQTFMDSLEVISEENKGTKVFMEKSISKEVLNETLI